MNLHRDVGAWSITIEILRSQMYMTSNTPDNVAPVYHDENNRSPPPASPRTASAQIVTRDIHTNKSTQSTNAQAINTALQPAAPHSALNSRCEQTLLKLIQNGDETIVRRSVRCVPYIAQIPRPSDGLR